jgi:hypothetical protein
LKKKINFLEMVPIISEKIRLSKNNGVITISYDRNTPMDKLFNFIFKKPATIHIELDEIGTEVIELIDGSRNIHQICIELRNKMGEKVEPVIQRTSQFVASLNRNGFVKFR